MENGKGGIKVAIYIVQSDGKAQKGLKKGDEVVTGGGTYRITGVNADGSYKSEKVNNTTTSTYKGSYANSGGSSGGGGSSYKGGGSSGGGSSNKNSQYSGYTIGSDYGKQVAQDMDIDETFTATDGSVWKKEKDGTITVKHNGQTFKNTYKPSDLGTIGRQQVEAGVPYQYVEKTLYDRLDKIANDPSLSQHTKDGTYWMMYNYIQDQKNAEAKEEYEDVVQDRPDDYDNPYKAEIDYLLNQILNREGFSYDAMNDPLYQQYADMYRREGDRAMKETMAEAAAGAGGMNTYAITAAQQANNYYNSKLNDIIPELYGVAYDKYLKDIDLKIQDLGILQDMDDTQYNRYRDTMDEWQKDRNFAYGVYYDDVQQGNWRANFDNNNFWKNKDFDYNEFWDNKKWNANEEDKIYDRNQSEQDEAKAEVEYWMEKGIMPDEATIAKSGMNRANIEKRVAQVQAEQLAKGTSSGDGSPGGPKGIDPKGIDYDYIAGLEKGSENYMSTDEACAQKFEKEGWAGVQKLLNELREEKEIDQSSYMKLYNKYRDK